MAKKSKFESALKSGHVQRGDDDRLQLKRLPFGIPNLDEALGGGIPWGSSILIVGPESTGKTILSQYAIAQAQKTERPLVLYLDTERTYDRDWWESSGVDPEKLFVVRAPTGEEIIDIATDALLDNEDIGMVVVDSLAGMPPSRIVAETAERQDIGSLARLVQLLYIKLTSVLEGRILIATNQLRENISGYAERYPGGQSQKYFSHIILRTRREGWLTEGDSAKNRIGFNMEVQVTKNKTAPPQGTVKIPFRFNSQMDLVSILIDEAIADGRIVQKLPYYQIGDEKILGKENLRRFVMENPDAIEGQEASDE